MSLVDEIKNSIKRSGSNKSKIMYFREGTKVRVRFLEDLEDGRKFTFHDSFARSINVVCQEHLNKPCKYCEDEDLRTRDQYCWCVYDYEANEVKLLLAPVNNCSPVPAIMSMYEAYGTITDRDYVITANGKQQNKTFSVVPMDKNKFRNEKAKPLSESKILSILDKAFPADDEEEDEEDDYEPKKKTKNTKGNKKKYEEPEEDEEDIEEEGEEENDEEEVDYESMKPIELYKLCKARKIDCAPKKNAKYYINLLEEADKADEDWDDEEEDDWDE